jgi:hypothetical protein
MYVYLDDIHQLRSMLARSLAAFFYGVNPASVMLFSLGAMAGLFLYSMLPLLLLFFSRMLEGRNRVFNALVFTAILGLTNWINRDVLVILFPVTLLLWLVDFVHRKRSGHALMTLALSLFSFVTAFLVTMPFYALVARSTEYGELIQGASSSQLLEFMRHTYEDCTLPNLLRMLVTHLDWYRGSYPGPFGLIGYLFPILAFSSILLVNGKEEAKRVFFSVALVILTFVFLVLTRAEFTTALFLRVPLLFVLRESGKLMPFIPLAYAPLIAFTVEKIFRVVQLHSGESRGDHVTRARSMLRIVPPIACVLLVVSNIACNPLILSGDMGMHSVLNSRFGSMPGGLGDMATVDTPLSYYRASEWINHRRETEGFFRTLWLPIDRNIQQMLYPLDTDIFFSLATDQGRESDTYVRVVFEHLIQNKSDIGELLGYASVRYVVVNQESKFTGPLRRGWAGLGVVGDPQNFVRLLDKQEDLTLIVNRSDFMVYDNQKFLPRISAYDKAVLVKLSQMVADRRSDDGQSSIWLELNQSWVVDSMRPLGIDSSDWLILGQTEGQISKDDWLFMHSNVIVLPDGTRLSQKEQDELAEGAGIVLAYEGASLLPKTGEWERAQKNEAMNSEFYRCKESGSATIMTEMPRSGYYTMFLHGSLEGQIRINGDLVDFTAVSNDGQGWNWYRTQKFHSEKGKNEVLISCSSGSAISYVVVSGNIEPYVQRDRPEFTITSTRLTEHWIRVECMKPTFIIMRDSYHPSWEAYSHSAKLSHWEAGWANVFYLEETGNVTVRIAFSEQDTKNKAIIVLAIVWIAVLAGIFLCLLDILPGTKKPHHRDTLL